MKLIIAEKAIAGRRIAALLAGKEVPQQNIGKAPAFEFEREGEKHVVVPLRGHIVDVDFPKQYTYWLGTDLKKLTNAEIEYKPTEPAIVSALKNAGSEATSVIVATDADREGESIGLEAVEYATSKNPKIKVERAYFSAITQKDIETAFSNLTKLDKALADSANARREIDLIWGAVLTRFISLVSGRLGKEFLSAGRVQTPTLAIIVAREKERLAFKQETYWEIVAKCEKEKKLFEAMHKKGRFKEKKEAEAVMAKRTETLTVTSVKSSERTLAKPIPFNTTAFLRAATGIGFSAGEAMNIAESLYQQGYTSYPRTDNSTYPKNLDLKEIMNELLRTPDFASEVEKIFALGKLTPSKGKETKDHPPIHPVTNAPRNKLTDRQWKIYELIVRRFLATLAEDAKTLNLKVEFDMNGEPFNANGQRITKLGWKEFYPYSTLKEVILPKLEKGDKVILKNLDMNEKQTQPPSRYSQGGLIKLMEELGLGTKSTRHETIKKLYSRQYISGLKSIEPNKIGFAVIDVLEKHAPSVTKPKMTSELEKSMDQISASKKEKPQVVKSSREFLLEILEDLLKNKDKIGSELRVAVKKDAMVGPCPTCDGQLRILTSRNNKRFLGCTGYPKCTTTFPLPQKGKIVVLDKICEECGTPMIKIFGARYRYEMCVDPNCKTKADWGKKKEEWQKKKAEAAKKKAETAVKKAKTEDTKANPQPVVAKTPAKK